MAEPLAKTAFFYPEQSASVSTKPPSEQVKDEVTKAEQTNNAIINLTEGRIRPSNSEEHFTAYPSAFFSGYNKEHFMNPSSYSPYQYGRFGTNSVLQAGQVPPPKPNNGLYHPNAPACQGPHCGVYVEPTTKGMYAALATAKPPAKAMFMFPSTYRPGNNTDELPGIHPYSGNIFASGEPSKLEVIPDDYSNYAKYYTSV